jgi:MscS family membrane protein
MKKIYLSALFMIGMLSNLSAQQFLEDSVIFDLSTPYNTAKSFVFYSQPSHFNEELLNLCTQLDPTDSSNFSLKLIQLIRGEGISINLNEISKNPDYIDSLTNRNVLVLSNKYPQLYLEKIGKNWVIPRGSKVKILALHDKVFSFGNNSLLDLMITSNSKRYLGITAQQYLFILLFLVTAFSSQKLLNYVIAKMGMKAALRMGLNNIAKEGLLPVTKPLSSLIVILLISFFYPILQLPAYISVYVVSIIRASAPLLLTIISFRLIKILGLYLEKQAKKTESTLDDQLVPIVRKSLRVFVVLVGTLAILQSFDISIIPLLTGLSIGGLAFALAAQDTIKNFFGSVMIFVDKPFQVGHWITSGEIDGTIEEVGFRSTRIRTFTNSVMYIPNGKLADATINNHGLRVYRRFYTNIGLAYETAPDKIQLFVNGLEKIVQDHPYTAKDNYNIYLNEMGPYSLGVMFYIFFEVPEWSLELKARHEVLLAILKLGQTLGVNFAYPTQTLHMAQLSKSTSFDPHDEKEI